MTDQVATQQDQQKQENKNNDKEYNFRQLEAKYEKMLAHERSARVEAEKMAQEFQKRNHIQEEEDDESEPYVDHKRLSKKLNSFERKLEEKIEQKAEEKARGLFEKEKRESWLKSNNDFYEVLQHADKLAEKEPELADTILQMPDNFERQKLVYKNIKALGLHKAAQKESSVQDKINANRRSPYYQPSGIGTAPYATSGDFSPSGQKQAYSKLQELKNRLRLG